VRYDKFLSHGKLLSHEEARKRGDLEMFDDFDELKAFNEAYPTIFISHQWLGWTEPDPENVHYEAIAKAVDQLFQMRLASRGREAVPETTHIYLWVDYLSIPQQNKVLQQLSISSLSVYSSICRFFIMVAPPARHVDADNNCSAETYQKRGWCRLEQMARMSIGGLHHLYLYGVAEGSTTVSLTPIADLSPVVEDPSYSMMRPATQEGSQERASTSTIRMLAHRRAWYRDSIRVYQGNFTVDADKSKLVDTMLSFWGYLLKNRHSSGGHQELYELVEEHKEEVFPKEYFGDLIQLLELLMEAESVLNESSRSGRLGTVAADARHTTRQTTRQTTRRSPGDLGNHERHLARWRMRRHHYMAGGMEVERRQSAALAERFRLADDKFGALLERARLGLEGVVAPFVQPERRPEPTRSESVAQELSAAQQIRNYVSRLNPRRASMVSSCSNSNAAHHSSAASGASGASATSAASGGSNNRKRSMMAFSPCAGSTPTSEASIIEGMGVAVVDRHPEGAEHLNAEAVQVMVDVDEGPDTDDDDVPSLALATNGAAAADVSTEQPDEGRAAAAVRTVRGESESGLSRVMRSSSSVPP